MTREEAIDVLSDFRKFTLSILGKSIYAERCSALDMAIEALRREEAEAKGYCHRIKPKEDANCDCVAVVRCKDCKWAEKAILDEYCVECTMYHTSCMKHGYCHHGERREDANTD